jgi:hypothetical protein
MLAEPFQESNHPGGVEECDLGGCVGLAQTPAQCDAVKLLLATPRGWEKSKSKSPPGPENKKASGSD